MIFEELAGTEVIIIDDVYNDVQSLEESLKERKIKTEYVKADLIEGTNHSVVNSVKLVFLDLHYGYSFDASFCAGLIMDIVPEGRQYYLVAWTQDPEKTQAVIEELHLINRSPIAYTSRKKDKYRIGNSAYDINLLLDDIEKEFDQVKEVHEFYGRIIEIEEDQILINCLINRNGNSVYQIRRFDKSPFENYIDLKVGNYVVINSITKPGSRLFEFNNGHNDLVKYFPEKVDFFKDIDLNTLFDKE